MKELCYTVVLVIVFLITSCAYYPRLTDIPLINKKGDTRLEGGMTSVPSAHATVSYGLTDKIAVQASGSIGGNNTYGLQGAAGIFSLASAGPKWRSVGRHQDIWTEHDANARALSYFTDRLSDDQANRFSVEYPGQYYDNKFLRNWFVDWLGNLISDITDSD